MHAGKRLCSLPWAISTELLEITDQSEAGYDYITLSGSTNYALIFCTTDAFAIVSGVTTTHAVLAGLSAMTLLMPL